jgi:lipopolysaccharide/colanic/teichoic acid biosynthesis glycosyltransferase/glycosyltransferase involved in cell wall biosynthesis
MALTRTSPLLAGAGERRLGPKSEARRPRPAISRSVVIFAHDLAAALASLGLALLLREGGQLIWPDVRLLVAAAPLLLALAAASFLAFGLHRRIWSYTSIGDLGAIVKAATWTVVPFVALGAAGDRMNAMPPAVWVIQWLILVALLCGARLAYRFARTRARGARAAWRAPASQDVPVLLYGCGPMASLFIGAVQSTPGTSVRLVGIVDDAGIPPGRSVHNVPVLGAPTDLDRVVADLAVQGIHPQRLVITRTAECLSPERRIVVESWSARHRVALHFLPDLLEVPAAQVASAPASGPSPCDRAYFRIRRPIEVSVSALALLVLMPLIGLIALAVLVDRGRPILFRQVRPGRSMRPFTLYKFRTMRGPRDARGAPLRDQERTSPLGRVLRRTRLDELPQLLNVVRGEMSFIGPRPLMRHELPDHDIERIAVRPGITGWAQVNGGKRLSVEDKIALDSWYLRNAGPWLDLRILCRTLKMMVLGQELDRLEPEPAPAAETGRQRLLVVNRFFHPDPCATSQLLTDLVDALDARGFAVTVLAGRHSYLNTGRVLPARAWRGGIEVRRLRHTGFGRFSLFGRSLDGLSFAASAFLALLARARPGDLILAKTDPPLISVLAWLAARLTGARLVNWCQDLFPETAAAMGLPLARGPLGGALRAMRNASLRGATMNVALCPGMAARLAAQGVPRARLTVVPNWADGALIRPLAPEHNPLRAAWGLGDRLVIGYSGNLGRAHEVDAVVELMTLLADAPELLFLFIGAGSGYRTVRAAVALRALENVVFRPYQDRAELPWSLTAPDLHLVTLRPEWEGLVMPSKLYGALAAGRPVVFVGDPDGDVARIVRGGAGLVASPQRMPALAAEIRALRRDPERRARMGQAARRAYEAYPKDASLEAWSRCLRAAALPAATRPLAQAVAAK